MRSANQAPSFIALWLLLAGAFVTGGPDLLAAGASPGGAEYSVTPDAPELPADLQPGDRVIFEDGTYPHLRIVGVHGTPEAPITFSARTPGGAVINPARTIGKSMSRWKAEKKLGPHVYSTVITEEEAPGEWFSLLVMDEAVPFVLVGADPVYDKQWRILFGDSRDDVSHRQFYFDARTRRLYVGQPNPFWHTWQLGTTRDYKLRILDSSYVHVRGFTVTGPNRQTARQWASSAAANSHGIRIENCRFLFSDHKPFSMNKCRDSEIVGCEFAYGGSSGMTMSLCTNVRIAECWFHDNGFRQFVGLGIMAGLKAIPENVDIIVSECLFERNEEHGLWFDTHNRATTRNNVSRYNVGEGFRWEKHSTGQSIGDVAYGNTSRGFYLNNRAQLDLRDAVSIENGEGVAFKGDVADGSRIVNCVIANNHEMDLYLPATRRIESNHNHLGPGAKVSHPWDPPVSIPQWLQHFDKDSDFTNPVNYRIGRDSIEILPQ